MREQEAKSKLCFMSFNGDHGIRFCRVSECMAWRWFGADQEGYCKLVDAPPPIYPAKVTET